MVLNVESLREYCLKKPYVSESMPFSETALVFKVFDKMFALLSLNETPWINLKCDPEKAIRLRESYSFVTPGYHMNKKHWNTINFEETLSGELILEWIDHSYNLVVEKLPGKQRKLIV